MKKLFEKIFQPKKSESGKSSLNKVGYVIILGLVGLLLIILSNIFSTEKNEANPNNEMQLEVKEEVEVSNSEKPTVSGEVDELEASYKEDLEAMLNKIHGVSEAEVMVNLSSTNVNVYEKNLIRGEQSTDESDRNGGTRKVDDQSEETQVVFVRQGDREVPLLVRTDRPEVSGVFVVAKGAENANIKNWIVEAVSRVLNVPTHRVSVMPKSN
ncbi:stage III sporulation protein AG [Oceanobacillus piezotolerans]|uniref:Stage III sporulation protein AG n=1 Tax=Oceanobacillus piezotolerans TaxID=2448030 RepID=A0A498DD11_9BACI|nr:stage III sporulation protein AG [Oceanobacillus piezotolerans]RLL48112.1 stage III sporulation protein AG [Oceanobacillus piezotolerans]